jgi:hypothetical protein
MCVTCSQTNSTTYIRVQTNGLPNHCYSSPNTAPIDLNVDFTVKFQWDVGTNIYNSPTTQTEINNMLCTPTGQADSTIPAAASYSNSGTTSIDTAVGVGLSGVMLFNGASANDVDPLYPAIYGSVTSVASGKEMFDMCLRHPQE